MWNRHLFILLAASLCSLGLTACKKDASHAHGGRSPDSGFHFSIGGTVTGSTGPLTLQNSNGAQLVVAASGAFTFARSMPTGASYNVTVATPPTSQSCTVTNGSGTVAMSNCHQYHRHLYHQHLLGGRHRHGSGRRQDTGAAPGRGFRFQRSHGHGQWRFHVSL